MTTFVADEALKGYLKPITKPTEIRDADGKLLGVFTPSEEAVADRYAEISKLFDPEEIRRRKEREGHLPGYTIEQVMEHLRSLEGREKGR
jgi:hypothetical protein